MALVSSSMKPAPSRKHGGEKPPVPEGMSRRTNTNATAYQGDVTFSDQTDAYYQVRFTGTRVKLVTEKHDHMGIVAVSVVPIGIQLLRSSPATRSDPPA